MMTMKKITLTLHFVLILMVSGDSRKFNLNADWTIRNENGSLQMFNVQMPKSVQLAMVERTLADDPLYGLNDVQTRWISRDNWVFEKTFNLTWQDVQLNTTRVNLEFDSIDTIANVYLNRYLVLSANNEFVKYTVFDVNARLVYGVNKLRLEFKSPVRYGESVANLYPYKVPPVCDAAKINAECNGNFIRKQQFTFGSELSPAVPTVGLNGNVYLTLVDSFDFDMSVNVQPSADSNVWHVDLRLIVNFNSFRPLNESLLANVTIDQLDFKYNASLVPTTDVITLRLEIANGGIEYWYPAGYGSPRLYSLTVRLNCWNVQVVKTKNIGFRRVQLVQDKLANSTGLTFYYKINNQPVFLKGSHWIPTSLFAEKNTLSQINWLLKSTLDANANVIRVRGGGKYETDKFYDRADEMGLLILHNFMFDRTVYPKNADFVNSVTLELGKQIDRLQHHPSIIAWEGGYEVEMAIAENWYSTDDDRDLYTADYRYLFGDVMGKYVASVDQSRPYVRSTPSNGDSLTNGVSGNSPLFGDTHFFDYTSDLWSYENFNLSRMMSSFGVQSFPEFRSLSSVYTQKEDVVYGSKLNEHRQHRINGNTEILNQIANNLQLPFLKNEANNFKALIYLSQVNQAMTLKTGIELYRRNYATYDASTGQGYCMGVLHKQLNDLWLSPTWSTIDSKYTWKMAHYYMQKSFANVLIVPFVDRSSQRVVIYAVTEQIEPINVTLVITYYAYNRLVSLKNESINLSLDKFSSNRVYDKPLVDIEQSTGCSSTNDDRSCLLTFDVPSIGSNFLLLNNKLKKVGNLARPNLYVESMDKIGDRKFAVNLKTDNVALFVWLEFDQSFDQYNQFYFRFSDNGFHLTQQKKTIQLEFFYMQQDADNLNVSIDQNYLIKHLTVNSLTNIYNSSSRLPFNFLSFFSAIALVLFFIF